MMLLICRNLIYFAATAKPMNNFYYLSSCDTCKRIQKELELKDTVEQIDIKKNPIDAATLDRLYAYTKSYGELLNRRAQKLKGIDKESLTEEKIKSLLLEHYSFLKRPVLEYNNQLFVGNAKATIAAAKAALHG